MVDLTDRPIKNARYGPGGTINVEVEHPEYGWIPYTANPHDPEEGGRRFFEHLVRGVESGEVTIAPYVPPSDEELAAEVRAQRDLLLSQTDWTQLPDVPQATRGRWAEYRQALRDITLQDGFPAAMEWPEPPN